VQTENLFTSAGHEHCFRATTRGTPLKSTLNSPPEKEQLALVSVAEKADIDGASWTRNCEPSMLVATRDPWMRVDVAAGDDNSPNLTTFVQPSPIAKDVGDVLATRTGLFATRSRTDPSCCSNDVMFGPVEDPNSIFAPEAPSIRNVACPENHNASRHVTHFASAPPTHLRDAETGWNEMNGRSGCPPPVATIRTGGGCAAELRTSNCPISPELTTWSV